jgi:hypothetical protein
MLRSTHVDNKIFILQGLLLNAPPSAGKDFSMFRRANLGFTSLTKAEHLQMGAMVA